MKVFIFVFLITAGLLVLNDHFVFESIVVPSSSMRPTILPNERIFVRRFGLKPFERNDIVVVGPRAFGHRIIKRIVGMPGECVQLKDSWQVYINGKPLEESQYIQKKQTPGIHYDTNFGGTNPFCLKADEYYVLGDNRLASGDSRVAGPIHENELEGKAKMVWYSFDLTRGIGGPRWDRIGTWLK